MYDQIRPAVLTIRTDIPGDEPALRRLAQLDSAPLPDAPLLLAFADGELRAAISLRRGSVVADPFHRTAELVDLLRRRADATATSPGRRSGPIRRRIAATQPSVG